MPKASHTSSPDQRASSTGTAPVFLPPRGPAFPLTHPSDYFEGKNCQRSRAQAHTCQCILLGRVGVLAAHVAPILGRDLEQGAKKASGCASLLPVYLRLVTCDTYPKDCLPTRKPGNIQESQQHLAEPRVKARVKCFASHDSFKPLHKPTGGVIKTQEG